jgi:hypothetical protein
MSEKSSKVTAYELKDRDAVPDGGASLLTLTISTESMIKQLRGDVSLSKRQADHTEFSRSTTLHENFSCSP